MVTINEQAFLFLTCVQTGIMMGLLYDLIRVLRKIIYHPNWVVQLEDFLYWVTCGCFSFIMVFWKNYGQIRGFVFFGILIGAVLYFATISDLVMKILTKAIKRFVLIPIRCIMRIVSIPIRYFLMIYKKLSKKRKVQKEQVKIKLRKRRAKFVHQLKIIKAKK